MTEIPTPAPMRRRWLRHALLAGTAAVAAVLATWFWNTRSAAAPQYTTVEAGRGGVAVAVVSSGTVNPETTVQVGSYVSGVIESIRCDFNTRVKARQLCAKIDPRPYQTVVDQERASLGTARAQLQKDRANLDFAKVVRDRDASLLQRGIVSQETADTSENAYRQAVAQLALDEASVSQHEAQLKAAQVNIGYTDIVSPVDGTVVSRNVTQGQTVAASFQTPTLFLIATDLTRMEVDTNVSESDIGRIASGQRTLFTVDAYPERTFEGRVVQVRQAPQTVQNVVTYDVVVGVANPDLALRPGMTASVRIVVGEVGHALRVPSLALRYAPGGSAAQASARPGGGAGRPSQVWVLADGRPRRVAVNVGLDDDAWAEVTGGELHEGDAVIVSEHAAAAHGPTVPYGIVAPRR